MKSAIRMAMVVMMAGASTAAFATAGDNSSYEQPSEATNDPTQTKFETATPAPDADDQDIGHGSGEPGRSERMTKVDDATAEKAAIEEYNQRNYLNQTWMGTP